jgi:translation initiation factor 1
MKNKKFKNDLVYSTDPNIEIEIEISKNEELTLEAEKQKLYIELDRKSRKGKTVTVVSNFIGNTEDLKELGKNLKNLCAVGGTVKNRKIEIQGDFKNKIKHYLLDRKYNVGEKG